MPPKPRLVVIGGGILGVTIAREAALSSRFAQITILEKEGKAGTHASTRNSGVIHAGFYYDPDSERGRFCAQGSQLMRDYCSRNNLPVNKCGKVVVSRADYEDSILENLLQRGQKNGCTLHLLDAQHLSEYEPHAVTNKLFLWSPNTWSSSPRHVMDCLVTELKELGVALRFNSRVVAAKSREIYLDGGDTISYDYVINAAGGYALSIAKMFGYQSRFELLPFKGLYLKTNNPSEDFRTHVYPVPNSSQPFLGIHTTLTFDGFLKLGPTALPAFSPENYSLFQGIDWSSLFPLLTLQLGLFLSNGFGFRSLALKELSYLLKSKLVDEAQSLVSVPLDPSRFSWYSPGIRAQLYDTESKTLQGDFILEISNNAFHVLNSISPSWTCSLHTAKVVLSRLLPLI